MAEVGCAGILVTDTFCGPMSRIPRPGLLAVVESIVTKAGGCAVNTAIALAKQGIEVDVAGCVGEDAEASVLLSSLGDHGVGTAQAACTGAHPTSRTVILLVDGEDRRYIHTFGANKAFAAAQIQRDWLAGLKVFYLGGLFALPAIEAEELLGLLKFCREKGVVSVVDVVVPPGASGFGPYESLLPYIDYFLPNEDEARQLTGHADHMDQLRTLLRLGANTVIITRGHAGAVAAVDGNLWQAGVYEMTAVDPSGAGDAFAAGVIMGIRRGYEMPDTLRYASALAASATRAMGTTDGIFTADELESFVAANRLEVVHGSID